MIYIYCDPHQTQQVKEDDYTWGAGQMQDYIPLRQKLRYALDDEAHDYIVYIQHPILASWLIDLRDYGPHVVHWEEINLRDRFRKRFGFLPPLELGETAIKELNLLDLSIPNSTQVNDPDGWVLGQCIDHIWERSEPGEDHLSNLAAWAVQAEQIRTELALLAQSRLKQWTEIDNRYQIFVDHGWREAGELILIKWALNSYPADFALKQKSSSVPLVDCSRHLNQCRDLFRKEKYKTKINEFWGTWLSTAQEQNLRLPIEWMSGLADVELGIFERWVNQNLNQLTLSFFDRVEQRFSYLPDADNVLKRVKALIPPALPSHPDHSWSAEKWLTWVTDEYMPYLAWTLRHNQTRDTQISLANQFADWLVSAYPRLMFDKSAPFITNQPSHLQKIVDTGQADVVFWLIVDGLTWWQGKGLVDNFVKYGLTIAQLEPNLSALPSLTFISKRALAQGYLDQSTEKQPIKKILEDRLLRDTSSAHIFTQTTQFEAVISSDLQPGIYVLLYNALDRHNHDTQNFTDDESVEGHLRLLARLTNDGFQQCTRQGLRARALVSSDHGSTLLPSNTDVLSVPSFAQIIDDENGLDDMPSKSKDIYQRTRACTINNLPDEKELTRLEQDWYLLRGDIFNLPQHFLIPKGYAAVKRRPTGWTHGGGTPEETVTAFIEVQPEAIEIIPPVVEVEGFLLPDQTSTLQITIVNPNSTPLRTVRFNFANMPPSVEVTKISPNSQTSSDFSAPIATSKGKTQALEWQFTCEVGGRTWQFSGREEIPVRRFQVSEVDDLFEDML